VYSWNRLHAILADLFCIVTDIPNKDIALAIWNCVQSDSSQRKMLRAAAAKFPDDSFERDELLWILDSIDRHLANKRNDAIHAPLGINTKIVGDNDPEHSVNPDINSGSRRAKNLSVKSDILAEFRNYSNQSEQLADHAHALCGYIFWKDKVTEMPFPDRPILQESAPQKNHTGSARPQKAPKQS
jgi:hypothetical protein